MIGAFIYLRLNTTLSVGNVESCSVAPWLLSVKSITSSPDQLPWKLLDYFCLSRVFPAWGGYFGQINTLLFWEQGLRSMAQMRSPLKTPEQQNNRQQDKTRTEVENEGLGNYWHPLLASGLPEVRNGERTCPAVSSLKKYLQSLNILLCETKEREMCLIVDNILRSLPQSWWLYFVMWVVCVCVWLWGPWENTAHYFRGVSFPLRRWECTEVCFVCAEMFRAASLSVCLWACLCCDNGNDLCPRYHLIMATNESVVVCGCVLLCTLMSACMKESLLPSGCLRFQPGVAVDGRVFSFAARYYTYVDKNSWTQFSVCVCVFSLHYITKDSRKPPTFPSKKKEDIIMSQTKESTKW